jgi:hypothetical protein
MLIITTNIRPIRGRKEYFRAHIRHGESEVHSEAIYTMDIH